MDVQFMSQLLHHKALRWELKECWESMLNLQIGELFTAWFINRPVDDTSFPTLGGENKQLEKEIR